MKFSRRYKCTECGNKGRTSRRVADTGKIICPVCETENPADFIKVTDAKAADENQSARQLLELAKTEAGKQKQPQ